MPMDAFTKLFGNLLVFVYHCFDRIVINGYLEPFRASRFKEMPFADVCCGSAGIYNVVQHDMSMQILERKMEQANSTQPEVIATANTGCMLQLRAGVQMHGKGQRVAHVIEILDEAYRKA